MTAHQAIPAAALKKHIAILGMNGSGKTSVAKSQIIEPALDAGERVCNVDPTGVGWGLRLGSDGKRKGFAIYIVGGDHADFPLFRRDAKAWGEIVGTSSDSYVFDTSQMTVEDRSQWFTDFAETLIRKNKGPLKLVLDEAHLFAPQAGARSGGIAPRMLHATNNLLALGRSKGLIITMISQRPAKLHKDSLTQAHTLIAMALMAPQDRGAVKDWIADQADAEHGKDIIASLPSLKPGEAWVWAPKEGVLDRVTFGRPRTFDSSSAPSDAEGAAVQLSPINPDAIKARLAEVAKETVASDPKALRAEIARLNVELQKAPKNIAADPKAIENADRAGYERGFKEGAHATKEAIMPMAGAVIEAAQTLRAATLPAPTYRPVARPVVERHAPPPRRTNGAAQHATHEGQKLPKAYRRVLTALAQYPDGRTKNQVAVLTGYAVNGGGFNNAVSALRSAGFLSGTGDRLEITTDGANALGNYEPLPTGAALLEHWMAQLPKAERESLKILADHWPDAIPKETLADHAGYAADGGGFNNALSRLRTLELISGRGELRASNDLFD